MTIYCGCVSNNLYISYETIITKIKQELFAMKTSLFLKIVMNSFTMSLLVRASC